MKHATIFAAILAAVNAQAPGAPPAPAAPATPPAPAAPPAPPAAAPAAPAAPAPPAGLPKGAMPPLPKGAGKGPGAPKSGKACVKLADIKPIPDPFYMFTPGDADFHCDMGKPIPFGPAPKGCVKLEVIVARGTSEPGDFGNIVGDPLVARVKRDLKDATAQGYAVQYPAASTGSNIGVADVQKRMKEQIAACPDIKFALSGYSQGGMVIQTAIGQFTPDLMDRVVAVALFGGGDGGFVKDPLKAKTIANCAPGDFACPNGGTGPGHVSYNNKGTEWHDRSSQYIVDAFHGKSQGRKTVRNPTGPI